MPDKSTDEAVRLERAVLEDVGKLGDKTIKPELLDGEELRGILRKPQKENNLQRMKRNFWLRMRKNYSDSLCFLNDLV